MGMNAQALTMGDKEIVDLQESVMVGEEISDTVPLHHMLSD